MDAHLLSLPQTLYKSERLALEAPLKAAPAHMNESNIFIGICQCDYAMPSYFAPGTGMEQIDELVAGHVQELVQVHAPVKFMFIQRSKLDDKKIGKCADLYINFLKEPRAFFSPSSAILLKREQSPSSLFPLCAHTFT